MKLKKTMKLNKKLIAVLALALAAGVGLAACGTTSTPKPAPTVTHIVVTATPTAPKPSATTATPAPTTVAPAPTKTVYVAPAAPAPAAPSGTNCGGGVYAGPSTSCAFAQNVADGYDSWRADQSPGPYARTVYSPVTGQSYWMTYVKSNGVITATGGNNASVQFPG